MKKDPDDQVVPIQVGIQEAGNQDGSQGEMKHQKGRCGYGHSFSQDRRNCDRLP